MPVTHEVYALRYGTLGGRRRHENFVAPVDRPDEPMPLDYYVWTVHGPDGVTVVDTGFAPDVGVRRGRTMLAPVGDLLGELGVDPQVVRRVVLTHLHYDHAGNVGLFPAADLLVQSDEIAFATDEAPRHPFFGAAYEAPEVAAVQSGRIRPVDGTVELSPGLELHRVGGHTGGTQVVRVHTAAGWLVLASDALHFTENRLRRNPFPILVDARESLAGFARCEELADLDDLVIPGHDPQVAGSGERIAPLVRRLA